MGRRFRRRYLVFISVSFRTANLIARLYRENVKSRKQTNESPLDHEEIQVVQSFRNEFWKFLRTLAIDVVRQSMLPNRPTNVVLMIGSFRNGIQGVTRSFSQLAFHTTLRHLNHGFGDARFASNPMKPIQLFWSTRRSKCQR